MIRGHRIKVSLGQRHPQSLDVSLASERRVDLEGRVIGGAELFSEGQVMRGNLSSGLDSPSASCHQKLHRASRRKVQEVQRTTRVLGQEQISRHHGLLGQCRATG
jgi:hypothetical protein